MLHSSTKESLTQQTNALNLKERLLQETLTEHKSHVMSLNDEVNTRRAEYTNGPDRLVMPSGNRV